METMEGIWGVAGVPAWHRVEAGVLGHGEQRRQSSGHSYASVSEDHRDEVPFCSNDGKILK